MQITELELVNYIRQVVERLGGAGRVEQPIFHKVDQLGRERHRIQVIIFLSLPLVSVFYYSIFNNL